MRRREAKRLEELEIEHVPAGPPIGSTAPDFTLPSMRGQEQTLGQLGERGRPLVLVSVRSGFSSGELPPPRLSAWHDGLASELTIALLSEGSAEANRELLDGHGSAEVLLQKRGEIRQACELRQTPSAVVVAPDRKIASVGVAGENAIEELIRLTLRRSDTLAAHA